MDMKYRAHGFAMMSFIFAPPAGRAAKSVSQDRTKVNRPMKLDSSLHQIRIKFGSNEDLGVFVRVPVIFFQNPENSQNTHTATATEATITTNPTTATAIDTTTATTNKTSTATVTDTNTITTTTTNSPTATAVVTASEADNH